MINYQALAHQMSFLGIFTAIIAYVGGLGLLREGGEVTPGVTPAYALFFFFFPPLFFIRLEHSA